MYITSALQKTDMKAVGLQLALDLLHKKVIHTLIVGISSGQQNLMKTYHNEANTSGITNIASKNVLEFFGQSR